MTFATTPNISCSRGAVRAVTLTLPPRSRQLCVVLTRVDRERSQYQSSFKFRTGGLRAGVDNLAGSLHARLPL